MPQIADWRSAGLTHQGHTDTGIQNRIKFGRIYGSTRLDYIYLKEQDKHYDVMIWKNKGSGGTKRKANGNYYCDMRGSGADDYVWIYQDGHAAKINVNINKPPSWDHTTTVFLSAPGPRTSDGRCEVLVHNKASGALALYENHFDSFTNSLTFEVPVAVTPGTCSEGCGVGIFDLGMRLADIE
ncbi:hypothetical protein ACMFMF_010333 [Clarireedia jacksonii]